jgi:hypothetical protein
LKAIPPGQRTRIVIPRLNALGAIPLPANLDCTPLVGRAPWLRLRAGNFRILFRRLTRAELDMLVLRRGALDGETGFLVGRIVTAPSSSARSS